MPRKKESKKKKSKDRRRRSKEPELCQYQADGEDFHCGKVLKNTEKIFCSEHRDLTRKQASKREESESVPTMMKGQFEQEVRKVLYDASTALGREKTMDLLFTVLRNLVR